MAQVVVNPDEEVVLGEEIGHVRVITLNQPRRLNVISFEVVELLARLLEKWEKDDEAELILIKGTGRAFSAGGDLKMFYDGRMSNRKSDAAKREELDEYGAMSRGVPGIKIQEGQWVHK